MTAKKRTFFRIAAVLIAAVGLAAALWLRWPTLFSSTEAGRPSLRPRPGHVVSIRFDPSFHYDRKMRPEKLAAALAQKWSQAGINLVFYRVYDPRHGAFYRTAYRLNAVDDFGRYDLLGHVLEACQARGIRVFAWLPVLNHAGAWEANPAWRALTADGTPYTAEGLDFPLCARRPEVQAWWAGFIEDLLNGYPALDGVDLAEPVVSWKPDAACHCDLCRQALTSAAGTEVQAQIRAEALTRVLGDSVVRIRRHGKQVCITSVQGTDASGDLFPPREMMRITGFDLEGILVAEAGRRPDFLCPEFIWQEHRSRLGTAALSSGFDPSWTRRAVGRFLQQVDRPIPVVAHVEITDFPGVPVGAADLEAALAAAMAGGAAGVDVYNSDQLDRKSAWGALKTANRPAQKRCLVLFDRGPGEEDGENDALQVAALLGHFNVSTTVKPLAAYAPPDLSDCDAVFYVGTVSDAPVPDVFLRDLVDWPGTLCWLGFNLQAALKDPQLSSRWGLDFVGVEAERFRLVRYRQTDLPKRDPWTNVVRVADAERCLILAEAVDKDQRIPYAVRSGRRYWYFADVPTSHAIEGGRFLVFADLLHDILNEAHIATPLAMVRIEDVHPLSDPKALRAIADFLHGRSVPFHLSVVPFYVNPETNQNVGLHQAPELAEAVRYCVRKGGAVVMHGTTHQRFGETTSDYEFWDPLNDRPPEGENADTIRKKIERGLREFWSTNIYPLMWETPHYAGSQRLYETVESIFSLRMERPQSMDKIGTDQYFPYLVRGGLPDRYVVPENLGYVPLERPDPGVILDPARRMRVVRDGVASFFFHPFVDRGVLEKIVASLQKEGFRFVSVADLAVRVATSSGLVANDAGWPETGPTGTGSKAVRLAFPGVPQGEVSVTAPSIGDFERRPAPGELLALLEPPAADALRAENPQADKNIAVLGKVSNFLGEPCRVPIPLVIDAPAAPLEPSRTAEALMFLFRLVGVGTTYQEAATFSRVPEAVNLVVVPGEAALGLSDDQTQALVDALRAGHIALITSGRSPLADALGIETTDEPMTVESVRDNYFTDLAIVWDPPGRAMGFEAPGDAAYIYQDAASGAPLMVSGALGKGGYLYLEIPPEPGEGIYAENRYPHLLSHMFRSLGFFPPVRRAGGEVYFNPADREDVSIEALVKDWRRSGVGTVYVAAWQVFPEWTYDYARLIRLAHANGILVLAWFEPPYVNERFWQALPECREKNGLGLDAQVDWRRPAAMGSAPCREYVKADLGRILDAGDWDGVVINRAGWESENGFEDPATLTPFHPQVRRRFEARHGFDPADLCDPASGHFYREHPQDAARFEAFRHELAEEWLTDLLQWLTDRRAELGRSWQIVLTFDETRPHAGLSLEVVTELRARFGIDLQLATTTRKQWNDTPPPFDRVRLLIAVDKAGAGFCPDAPTAYPTGSKLYGHLNRWIDERRAFSIYSESALFEVDKQILPFLFAAGSRISWNANGLQTQLPASGKIVLAAPRVPPMALDGRLCATQHHHTVILPAGIHTLSPMQGAAARWSVFKSGARIAECSADLLEATATFLGVEAVYRSQRRAALVVTEKPLAVWVDDDKNSSSLERGDVGWRIMLPEGRHTVKIHTRTATGLALDIFSRVVSNTILMISLAAILGLVLIALVTIGRRRPGRRP